MSTIPSSAPLDLRQLFEEAVKLFEQGDLKTALRYFKAYLSLGGTDKAAVDDYVRRIGEQALKVGKSYHEGQLRRHAEESYLLAIDTGGGRHVEQALEMLTTMSRPPKMPEFRAVAPEPSERLWRRPHMDLSRPYPLAAGDAFQVFVYADRSEPAPGEESAAINIQDTGAPFYDLEAGLLASAHFRVNGPTTQPFRIERAKVKTDTLAFEVRVADAADLAALEGQPASLCVAFRYQGRPAGKILRRVEIAGIAVPTPLDAPKELPETHETIGVEAGAKPADLTLTITAQDKNPDRHFWCTVQTNLLPEYSAGVTEEWVTSDVTSKIVADYMQDFTVAGLDPFTRMTRLRGAGREMFKASPAVFQKAFWRLMKADVSLKTIAIISAEAFVPWELMIPYRPAQGNLPAQFREPLGVEFCVGRMTRRSLVSGLQKIALDTCYVVAPVFEGPNSLPHAQEEARFILGQIPGDSIEPANLKSLDSKLGDCRSLIHFACHGEVTDVGKQILYLGEDQSLSVLELLGLRGPAEGIPKARPLVFLNACRVGQPVPALIGVGGFAPVFTELGAAAVVAPLWSVKDTIAHKIALEFYTAVKADKSVTFSEIIRQQRAKAYDPTIGEDTYAAYCFYGDPLATPA
jgi:hypothetical protein